MFDVLVYCLEEYEKRLDSRDSMCDLVDDKNQKDINNIYMQ
jgi:hypothetical protein